VPPRCRRTVPALSAIRNTARGEHCLAQRVCPACQAPASSFSDAGPSLHAHRTARYVDRPLRSTSARAPLDTAVPMQVRSEKVSVMR
jgi:hypothetical protein